ncbi:unnamed protein product [Polarella glacialis]|uniref:Cytochrome b5 heme-binding domain-containing protein n=1 Tax=Polarella glacialis TaxID=89957 RepID=A0A813JIF5_POLGL|nr:unnamed protein product [Polarella glacialis]
MCLDSPNVNSSSTLAPILYQAGEEEKATDDEVLTESGTSRATGSTGCSSSSWNRCERFTLEEVQKHDSRDDCWLMANGKVYDVTRLVDCHPGGAGAILKRAGLDASRDFGFHSKKGKASWEEYLIGKVETSGRGFGSSVRTLLGRATGRLVCHGSSD